MRSIWPLLVALVALVPVLGIVAPAAAVVSGIPAQVSAAERLVAATLPAPGALAPVETGTLFRSPIASHTVLGFIGAGGFGGVSTPELADMTELVTNMTSLTATGALSTTTPGWSDLNDPGFPGFVATVHGVDDRLLLGIANGSPAALRRMLRTPANSATRLLGIIGPILAVDHLDGIDLDVEGGTAAERGAFTTFVRVLSRGLRRADPGSTVVVNVAPTAASSSGFFDVPALAGATTALFVMDYDLVPTGAAGPNAPLLAPAGEPSDLASLLAFTSVVPKSKLILGIPFYGYDFPTRSNVPGAVTTGPAESVTYGDIVSVGHVGHWDALSLTAYYVFKRGKQWHETYYDDPVSVALKTALASVFHLQGVGVWSLGQEGDQTAMLAALDGGSPPARVAIVAG